MMEPPTPFEIGSAVHIITLLGCALLVVATILVTRRHRKNLQVTRTIRAFVISGCLLSWILSNGFWLHPSLFAWEQSLPLHFCNLANLISVVAIWKRARTAQSLLYFWSFGLCIWAMLTPALNTGPGTLWFWLFWSYHTFIFVSVAVVLTDGFRPEWQDFRQSLSITLGYMALLAVVNAISGWNYGFVGEGMPLQPSPMDFLGPYPLRLIWIALVGTAIFAILMIPWLRQHPKNKPEP